MAARKSPYNQLPPPGAFLRLHPQALQFLNLFASEENLLKAAHAKSGEDLIATIDTLSVRPSTPLLATALQTVTPQTPLSKAVELFSATRAEALPVVDAEGNFVGELT